MSHTTLTRLSVTAALVAGAALFAAEAEAWPPGVAPPWANGTTSETPTTATSAPAPASSPTPIETTAAIPAAAPSLQTTDPSATPPVAAGVIPMQGTTTPIRAVSLRAGPNSSFPVIGTLRPGDQLQILAKANYGWTQVQSPAGTGWAYGSYLASGGSAAAGPPSEATPQ